MAHSPVQAELEQFLSATLAGLGEPVRRFETHGAVILVGPRETLKFKRPVRYSYMDFSTLDQRRMACAREYEVNRPHAPEIYLGLVAITREKRGPLALDGAGEVVEWAVRMRSFDQEHVLSSIAERGPLSATLAKALADMVVGYHETAPRIPCHDTKAQLAAIIADLDATFLSHPKVFPRPLQQRWRRAVDDGLDAAAAQLARRAGEGQVRRVHGDLHLGNIVLWEGRPVAFDAIEFDENLATIDTLYDLAFLLMDLDRHGHRANANVVLNRYLWRRQSMGDLEGLRLLPLMLSVRAGVRAMVGAQRAASENEPDQQRDWALAAGYLELADRYLASAPPVLVAVGGLSGTGKSTLAAALAPQLGVAPGAVHLRSDLERKAMLGAEETARLGAEAYTRDVSERVYARLAGKARAVLESGHAVIVDAVHAEETERQGVSALAGELGVPFAGLWLEASETTMKSRVEARVADASDATPSVVELQIARGAGDVGWRRIAAGGAPADVLASALAELEKQFS